MGTQFIRPSVRQRMRAARLTSARVFAAVLGVALAATMNAEPALAGSAGGYRPRPTQHERSVPVKRVAAVPRAADPAAVAAGRHLPAPAWPAAGAAEVDVPAAGVTASAARAGGLPVSVGRPGGAAASGSVPGRVRIEVLDRAAGGPLGADAVLLRIGSVDTSSAAAAAGGQVSLSVGYAAFRYAYGGDWANRLRLVRLPGCALTTPAAAGCRGVPLPSRNDSVAGTVTADVPVTALPAAGMAASPDRVVEAAAGQGAVYALDASTSGSTGDFSATNLAPSSTWTAGGSTGDFAWSYPMREPPAMGGPSPSVALSYSSGSVDGRTAASNNQPSWLGEGFEFSTGFIERRYKACSDDKGGGANNTSDTGDQCWGTDNAILSMAGHSGELVYNSTEGRWHLKGDDGSRVERLTDTGLNNGDDNGEYWKLTTTDGTQYFFGRNRLSGWTAGKPETGSTWTVPVFGNHPGEPCHQASYDASWCYQAWKWNLDYVVDTHGNTMSLWYGTETNKYARNVDSTKVTAYTRGGYPTRIDYGTDNRSGTDTGYSANPAARVNFTTDDRCLSGCATHDGVHWPDVPWDSDCSGSLCDTVSPTFWTTKRLSKVTTQVWGGSAYRDVESWTLRHTFPDPGDGTRAGLWLAGITHTGLVGTPISTPEVTFTGVQMNNRVDTVDNSPPMNWWRVSSIMTETGGEISVGYSTMDCVAGSRMPSAPESNTLRCMPVKWTPPGLTSPILDWFHKYVVTVVTETDHTGGAPRTMTTYEYPNPPAWHFDDDDGLVPVSRKSWAQWRGYDKVIVRQGDVAEQTMATMLFFRGMDGDKLPSGTRSVRVTDSDGGVWTDSDAFAGMTLDEITNNATDGSIVSSTVSQPWQSAPTASRTINGVTTNARLVETGVTASRTLLDGGRGWRRARTTSTFDQYGMPSLIDDAGDTSTADDDQCTRTTYARNTGSWLINPVARVEHYAVSCDRIPPAAVTVDDVINDVRTSYDGQAYGVAPTKGDATQVESMTDWVNDAPVYSVSARTGYDAYGRVTDAWDALNLHTTVAYTPAASGPLTSVTSTNPLGHTATTELEPAWGVTAAKTDPNGKRTDLAYDAFGRLTGVWLPGRSKATQTPNASYTYLIRNNGAVATSTSALKPDGVGYLTSYTLYDSLLRPRQSQAPSPSASGGRVIADAYYDSVGRQVKRFAEYYNNAAPGTDLVAPIDPALVPSQTRTIYDSVGRPAAQVFQPSGVEQWRTTTYYGGDHIDMTPPAGGTPTSVLSNARGQTTELRQYHGTTPTGAYDATTYTYTRDGEPATVTDAAGNQWSYTYDIQGRKITDTDPDRGTTTFTYTANDQVATSTDARGKKLVYSYDALGRLKTLYESSTSGPKRASWSYDTIVKGELTSQTRWVGTNAYTVTVSGYTDAYQPTGLDFTIPAVEGALAGTYSYTFGYNAGGGLASTTMPAAGGLASETTMVGYDATSGLPSTLSTVYGTTQSSYVTNTTYSETGNLTGLKFTGSGGNVYQTFNYEPGTGRLRETIADRDSVTPNNLADTHYAYDPAGNTKKIADTPIGASTDNQCFRYDYVQRLVEAWTPGSGDCDADPAAGGLGGPAPYWKSWTFDVTGNRRTQVVHATANGDATTTYTFPNPGSAQPHTLTGTSTTDNTGTGTASYTYDAAGNTLTRPGVGSAQTLAWDPEGHLASVTEGSATTSYLYDAGGNRLIARDPAGTTLYLPGTELRLATSTGQVSCTRYYSHAGQNMAMRTAAGVTWLIQDHHGTGTLAINADTQQVTTRLLDPYGNVRGPPGSWPNTRGFVGGTTDPTGLTHLGAREYDPTTGRFISGDPVFDAHNPQSMNGYAYANNSPVTFTDPDGLCWPSWACKAVKKASNWVSQNAGQIVGFAAGAVVGAGCMFLTAGAGSIGCAALAGAVGSMVTYAYESKVQHKYEFSWGGLALQGAIGAATGALLGGAGRIAGKVLGKAVGKVANTRFGKSIAGGLKRGAQAIKNTRTGQRATRAAAAYRSASVRTNQALRNSFTRSSPRPKEPMVDVFRFGNRNNPNELKSHVSSQPQHVQDRVNAALKDPAWKAQRAEDHMRGIGNHDETPFISVATSPFKAAATTDPWLQSITQHSPDIAFLQVPAGNLIAPRNTLSKTETEVLFDGHDLEPYLVGWIPNPWKIH